MSEQPPPHLEVESQPDLDTVRHLHEAERKNYWEAVNILVKSMTYYLAIMAASLGYALTRELNPPLPQRLVYAGLGVSLLYFCSLSAGVWALRRQMGVLQLLTNILNSALYEQLGMEAIYAKWKRVLMILTLCTFLVVTIFIVMMVIVLLG